MPSLARISLFGGLRSGVARRRRMLLAAVRVGVSGPLLSLSLLLSLPLLLPSLLLLSLLLPPLPPLLL